MQIDETTFNLPESECAERLASMWVAGDIIPFWPAATADVVELLRAGGGFDVNQEWLETCARSQQVGLVRIHGGKFSWAPSNVLRASALCNASRRWIPMHPAHVHKMTAPELAELQAAAVGQTIFSDIDSVDVRSLIGVISNTNDPGLRSVLCVALQTKLKKAGIE